MCGNKADIVYSCVQPAICEACEDHLKKEKISVEEISLVNKEMRRLQRNSYYRVVHIFKSYPKIAFISSCFVAFFMSVLASFATGCCVMLHYIIWGIWIAIAVICFFIIIDSKKHINF